jgi:anti-sigma28 factor (negative regulator of flagellin synthesis)
VRALRIPGDFGVKPPPDGKPGAESTRKTAKSARPETGDRVELSEASKRLRARPADEAKPTDSPEPQDALSKKQATIQERIASGFYDREEVINHIAKRILDLLGFK